MTVEALALLQSRIEDDVQLLDSPSRVSLQELVNAAKKTFTERALLLNENDVLFEQNKENNIHQSTRSTVASTVKVMSYEDTVRAQIKHNAKEAAVVKGKHS